MIRECKQARGSSSSVVFMDQSAGDIPTPARERGNRTAELPARSCSGPRTRRCSGLAVVAPASPLDSIAKQSR